MLQQFHQSTKQPSTLKRASVVGVLLQTPSSLEQNLDICTPRASGHGKIASKK